MMPILLHVGPFPLYSYAVLLALAFLLAGRVAARELQRRGLNPERAGAMTLVAAVAGIGGATLLAAIERWLEHPGDVASLLREGVGMTWYGGLVAATAALYLYSRRCDILFARVLDASAPALSLGYGIGRLGCHFAGDGDYGFPTSAPWGVSYAAGIDPPSRVFSAFAELASRYPGAVVPDDVPCHPVPLYECLVALIAFAVLTLLSRRRGRDGSLFATYLVITGGARFGFEWLRPNPRVLGDLTEAQLVSSAIALIGIAALTAFALRPLPRPNVETAIPDRGRVAVPWGAACLALLLGGAGCVGGTNITLRPGDPNNTVWVQGVRFESGVVTDGTQKVAPSSVYWLLAGEEAFVKWRDYHARVTIQSSIWDCNLCAELAARAQGHEICLLPDGTRPSLGGNLQVQLTESPIVLGTPGQPLPPTNPQTAGPFFFTDGCFTPGHPDVGPQRSLSFTVSRSGWWSGVAQVDGEGFGARPPSTATFWGIPGGGRLTMPPRRLVQYRNTVTGQDDPNHWIWILGVTMDADGKTSWDESFSPGITVGHVRLYTGRVVTDDPFFPYGYFLITGSVVPRRIRGYERLQPLATPVFDDTNLFRCDSDPASATGDGDIHLTRCRRDAEAPSRQLVTPGYVPGTTPPAAQEVRTPLTWVAEFNSALPAPTLSGGDDLWIEFTLQDVALPD